jgi:diacylglycerol kinase (ATP)
MARFFVDVAKSFRFAGRGIVLAGRGRNFRVMLAVALVVAVAAIALDVSRTSWAILLVCIAGVLAGETVNTAIEVAADRIESEHDPNIRDVKDLAAGAVLLGAGLAALIGVIVFWPYVLG